VSLGSSQIEERCRNGRLLDVSLTFVFVLRRRRSVVLMDELDQLFTAKQDVVYNFFNWPTIPGSQLVVIAVANTMDMPEKLAGRVKSRMGEFSNSPFSPLTSFYLPAFSPRARA